jgi:hypothetical protein
MARPKIVPLQFRLPSSFSGELARNAQMGLDTGEGEAAEDNLRGRFAYAGSGEGY